MKKILVDIELNDFQKKKLLDTAGEEAEFVFTAGKKVNDEDLKEIDGVIGNLDPALLSRHHNIAWIQLHSAGMDKYMAEGIVSEQCKLYNAVGAYGRSVSEHMLAVTLSITKRLNRYEKNQLHHIWKDEGEVFSIEGSTVLVIGLGDIGGAYARKMKALGAYVIGVRNSNKEKPDYIDEQYLVQDLERVTSRADIIASVLPSTDETRGIFGESFFQSCKEGVYFINAGRGDAVDYEALMEALDRKRIAGAALDVTVPEPLPSDHKLWDYDNVLLTPHVAGGFHIPYTKDRIVDMACQRLQEFL